MKKCSFIVYALLCASTRALGRYTESEWRDDIDVIPSKTSFFDEFLISFFLVALILLFATFVDKKDWKNCPPHIVLTLLFAFSAIAAFFRWV